MAKRIIIDIDENPALTSEDWEIFLDNIKFATNTYLDISEYTIEVKE